jgi:hypothetical protein
VGFAGAKFGHFCEIRPVSWVGSSSACQVDVIAGTVGAVLNPAGICRLIPGGGVSDNMYIGRVQVGEQHIMQGHHIQRVS